MEDFSDATNIKIILFTFFAFYMYLKFTQTQLKMMKNMGTVKCNPLEMVVGSIFNEEEANATFSKCMEYYTSENIQKKQEEMNKVYKDETKKLVDDYNEKGGKTLDDTRDLYELINKKTSNINNLVNQQKEISNLDENNGEIQGMIDDLTNIQSEFRDIANIISNDSDQTTQT